MPETEVEIKQYIIQYMKTCNLRYHRTVSRLGFVYDSYRLHCWWYVSWPGSLAAVAFAGCLNYPFLLLLGSAGTRWWSSSGSCA